MNRLYGSPLIYRLFCHDRVSAKTCLYLKRNSIRIGIRIRQDRDHAAGADADNTDGLCRINPFGKTNDCAMYRKDVYEAMGGFVLHTIFNEDMIMAARVIGAGWRIAYAAEAMVVHAHKYTCRQQFTRNFDLAVSQRQYREIFDGVRSESEGIRLVKDTAKYLLGHGKWYLLPELVCQSGFKFLGYRLGKKYERLPRWLVRKCSMNKAYWK